MPESSQFQVFHLKTPRRIEIGPEKDFLDGLGFFCCCFCPGTMTTHAESINSDLQRGLDRRLRHNIEHRTEPVSH